MKLKDLIGMDGKTFIFEKDINNSLTSTCPVYKTMKNSIYERILFFNVFNGERNAFNEEDHSIMEENIKLLVI